MTHVKVKIVDDRLKEFGLPDYATPGSAAIDLRALTPAGIPVTVFPGDCRTFETGLSIAIPNPNLVLLIHPRSGLGFKYGIVLKNGTGVIDSDYRGEIMIALQNNGVSPFIVNNGDRVCQAILMPVFRIRWDEVSELPTSDRGQGGFGHTGQA